MSNPYEPHDLRREEETRLRDLLDEATSDVEPHDALDDIRSRTRGSTTRRPWLVAAAAAAILTAGTVTAVAVVGSDGPDGAGPGPAAGTTTAADEPTTDDTPPSQTEPTRTSTPSEPEPQPVEGAVPVYYIGDSGQGPRLYREFHPGIGGEALGQALADAVGRTPDDPDYRSPWPAGTQATGTASADEIVVDVTSPGASLHDRPAGMGQDDAEMAVQQLVYTAQAATQTTAPVAFRLDGERTDQLLGVPVSEPLARGDETSTIAQVWIISPGEGARVQSPFKVSGVGAFFEANVAWELRAGGAGGRVVASNADNPVTAKECCTMADYSFTVDAPPGDYTLTVHDEDMSGGEGFPPFEDTKRITVTP